MLKATDAVATLATRDMKASAAFYEGKLGFVPHSRMGDELVTYISGKSIFTVYLSPQTAGTNMATAVSWGVSDVDQTVAGLKARGILFEHYDMPGTKLEGDVHVNGEMRVAWFKDPDGNILNLVKV